MEIHQRKGTKTSFKLEPLKNNSCLHFNLNYWLSSLLSKYFITRHHWMPNLLMIQQYLTTLITSKNAKDHNFFLRITTIVLFTIKILSLNNISFNEKEQPKIHNHYVSAPNCSFNYASVMGMPWYPYGHSRPDLGFAVSQAARFAFAPNRSHELALMPIGQCPKGMLNEGLIMKPMVQDHITMDVYVDSDFLGLCGKEDRVDPDFVQACWT